MSSADGFGGPKNQKARTFFQYGNDAALKSNFDYAVQMYREACKLEPDNLLYRQALRGIERRKFANDPAKVGRLVGARTQTIRMRARSAKSKGQWAQALEVCEEVFVHNPWDVSTARDAAEAAEQLGYKELAQWLIESVASLAHDADFFRYAAHVHELNAAWPKAIAAWERVKKLDPNAEDANRQINALSASATIQRAGLGEAMQKRLESSAEPEAAEAHGAEDLLKQRHLSPEDRWRKEIEDDPTLVGPYLQYAEHLKGRGRLDEAERVLSQGLKAVPGDPALAHEHEEVQIARLVRAIATWEKKAREVPGDDQARARVERLKVKLAEYEIDAYRRRLALRPGDASLQYEVGLRLAKSGRHKEAIAEFQQVARSNSELRVQALHQTGLSFEAEGQLKLAERSLQEALKAVGSDDQTTLNALHYRLGRVAEAMGNTAVAEEHYNEVAANDYSYLDVAQRLRGLG